MTRRSVADVAVDWQVEVQPGADPADGPGRGARLRRGGACPAGGVRDHHRPPGHRRPAPPRPPGRGWCSACPTATGAVFPRRAPRPGRRRLGGAARPADRGQPARRPRRHRDRGQSRAAAGQPSGSTGWSTCPRPTRCSRRSGHRPAPSRRRRPTTCCCCPPGAGTRSSTRSPAPARTWSAARSTPGWRTTCRADPAAAYTTVSGAARNLEAAAGRGRAGRRQPRRRPGRGPLRRPLRPGAVPVPRAARGDPGRAAHRRGRRRRPRPAPPRAGPAPGAGAATGRLVRLALVEAALVGVIGAAAGLAAALAVGRLAFGTASFGATPPAALGWAGAAALAGLAIAGASVAAARPAGRPHGHGGRGQAPVGRARPARLGPPRPRPVAAGRRRGGVLADQPGRLPARAGPRGCADHLGQLLGVRRPGAAVDRRRAARLAARRRCPGPRSRPRCGGRPGPWPAGWPAPSPRP